MLERYMEERMDPATKKRLKKAYKAMDKHKLQEVLDYCEQEGFVTDMTRKCTELLNQICDADEVGHKVHVLELAHLRASPMTLLLL